MKFIEIPQFNGRYTLTEDLRIWSNVSNRFMKLSEYKSGYFKVHLSVNGKSYSLFLHRIVASVYHKLDIFDKSIQVDHIKDKLNLSDNLRLTSNSGNQLARFGHSEINLIDTDTHKTCRKCKLLKHKSEFGSNTRKYDNLQTYCKLCVRQYYNDNKQ